MEHCSFVPLLLFLWIVGSSCVNFLYLDPSGSDANACTSLPCRTLSRIVDAAGGVSSLVIVNVGAYDINSTLTLTAPFTMYGGPGVIIKCNVASGPCLNFIGAPNSVLSYMEFHGGNPTVYVDENSAGFLISRSQFLYADRTLEVDATPNVIISETDFTYTAISSGINPLSFNRAANLTIQTSNFMHNYITASAPTNTSSGIYLRMPNGTKIDSCVFYNNSGGNAALMILTPLQDVIVTSSRFEKNTAQNGGGAVLLNFGTAHFTNCNFTQNSAAAGSAISALSAQTLGIEKSVFLKNFGASGGGAIEITSASVLQITDSTFDGNSAGSSGGAIKLDFGVATIENTIFHNNSVTFINAVGGAISSTAPELLTIRGSMFTNNSGTTGGAIYTPKQIEVYNSTFESNNAEFGSAMCLYQDTTIIDCSFSYNNATSGTVYFKDSTLRVSDTIFKGNSATVAGGIYGESCTTNLQNVTFSQNNAVVQGGGASFSLSQVTATKCNFTGNVVQENGGGLYLDNSTISLSNSTIFYNQAEFGGGIAVMSSSSGVVSFSQITSNHANFGGGLYLASGITINSSYILGNTVVADGPGIYINSTAAENGLVVINTQMSNISPFQFCCSDQIDHNFAPKNSFDNLLCNYPSCNKCGIKACDCPSPPAPVSTCTCAAYTGSFCNIINLCADPSFCSTTHFCDSNAHYSFICCTDSSCGTILNVSALDPPTTTTTSSTTATASSTTTTTSTTGPANQCTPAPNSCGSHANCTLQSGVYVCKCVDGYSGDGHTCTDINECLLNNGKCDFHTSCNNTQGSRTCTDCPQGFVPGNGDQICQPLCGDQNCTASLGENCVSCPEDCTVIPCGVCGDSFCDPATENCATCAEDCKVCKPQKCPGNPECSKNGICQNGVCICTLPWTGPSCSQDNSPVGVNFTQTDPGLVITSTVDQVSFTITLSGIQEVNEYGDIIFAANLTSQNFNFSLANFTPPHSPPVGPCENCSISQYISIHNNEPTSNKQWHMNTLLNNNAFLELVLWQFQDSQTTITYANSTSQFPSDTLKLSLQIRNWPFRALRNSLELIFVSSQDASLGNECSQVTSNQADDANNGLKWFSFNVNGVTLYGQFLDRAIVDGLVRDVNFTLNRDNSISAKIPHFWTNAVVDPNFSVLLGEKPANCQEKNSNSLSHEKKLIAIVVPVVVVAVIAIVVGILLLPQVRSRIRTFSHKRKFQASKSLNKEEIEIDRIHGLQANTAAGRFNVQL